MCASASASALKTLDRIHRAGLQLVAGSFRTSSALSLYAEADEISLEKRREGLGLTYFLRMRSVSQRPCREQVERTRFEQTFQSKPTVKPPLSVKRLSFVG